MKVLLSGNLGFIFSHFTEYLLKHGYHVTGIDALYDGSHHDLHYRLTPSDICFRYADNNSYFKLKSTIDSILCQ